MCLHNFLFSPVFVKFENENFKQLPFSYKTPFFAIRMFKICIKGLIKFAFTIIEV